jgi:hypothetical protein
MIVTKYFRPDDDWNKDEEKDNKDESSSGNVKQVEPLSIKEKEKKAPNLMKESRDEYWTNLIKFLVLNRSQLSMQEILKNILIFCFACAFGVVSNNYVRENPRIFSRVTLTLNKSNLLKDGFPLIGFDTKQKDLNDNGLESKSKLEPLNNKYYSNLSLDDKAELFSCLNQLILDFKKTSIPVSRFKIRFKSFFGLQIFYDKRPMSIVSQYDRVIDDQAPVSSNSETEVVAVVNGVLRQLITNWPEFKSKFKVRPVLMIGISFDSRMRPN